LVEQHENMEHLALIEKCIGRMPSAMASTASKQPVSNKFFSRGRLNWPARASSDESVEHVRKMRPLDQLILSDDKRAGLADLLRLMLTPDPDDRITAKDALSHPFFEGFSYRDVAPPSAVDAARASDANGSASRRSHSWRD
jgi:serine/threonine protein kinase